MGPKKTLERIKYSFFWEGLKDDVKKFCETCKECQLTGSVRSKDRSPITPVTRPELPFQVVNMDLIGPIDPPSLKGHKYILCLVDQHTRWGEAVPLTSLSAKLLYGKQPQGPLSILKSTWTVEMPDNFTKHIHQNKLRHYVASSNSVNVIFEEEKEFGQVETPPTATERSI
ncbi:transposon Ty3-G Gag-Pol polyprotein [Trichonephila clavipes]|nr:transposon Ty3-G Gag-Pol polyprotein [Trichonephila clavipes]